MNSQDEYSSSNIEQALEAYCKDVGISSPLSLFRLTSYSSEINPQLFGLIKDLRINLIFCNIEYIKAGLSNYIAKRSGKSIDVKKLMYYQHHTSNFVIRFRALGDKIMRLLLHLYTNLENIKKFEKSNSRKKEFTKISEQCELLKKYEDLPDIFRKLDEQYRTDEVHGMGGILRKSILTKKSMGVNEPIIQIGNYWNIFTNPLGILNDIYQETLYRS